jgi:hypothetical protein
MRCSARLPVHHRAAPEPDDRGAQRRGPAARAGRARAAGGTRAAVPRLAARDRAPAARRVPRPLHGPIHAGRGEDADEACQATETVRAVEVKSHRTVQRTSTLGSDLHEVARRFVESLSTYMMPSNTKSESTCGFCEMTADSPSDQEKASRKRPCSQVQPARGWRERSLVVIHELVLLNDRLALLRAGRGRLGLLRRRGLLSRGALHIRRQYV